MAERYDMERERFDRERDWERERRKGRDWDRERRESWGRGGNWGREFDREREGWGREPRYWDRERGWIEPRYERGEYGTRGEYGAREGWIRPEYAREGEGRYERPEYREGRRDWGREGPWGEARGGWAGYGGYTGAGAYGGGLGTYAERGRYVGRGPKTYQRSDDRIREDVNERLTMHPDIDATDIDVQVKNGEVTMTGNVESREMKRMAEDVVENVFGVKEVHNQLRIQQRLTTEQPGSSQGILGTKK
jgi:hypothetical protein